MCFNFNLNPDLNPNPNFNLNLNLNLNNSPLNRGLGGGFLCLLSSSWTYLVGGTNRWGGLYVDVFVRLVLLANFFRR